MADFENIIPWLLYQEDDKRTPGKIVNLGDGAGITRLGLTSRWHSEDVPPEFFSTMPFSDAVKVAKSVYYTKYWVLFSGDLIESDQVAAVVLSFAVNDNVFVAVRTLQRVLEILADGHAGPKTLAELNSKDGGVVAKLFRAKWEDFYRLDVAINPGKTEFLNGWINRANFPYPSPYSVEMYQ